METIDFDNQIYRSSLIETNLSNLINKQKTIKECYLVGELGNGDKMYLVDVILIDVNESDSYKLWLKDKNKLNVDIGQYNLRVVDPDFKYKCLGYSSFFNFNFKLNTKFNKS